MAKVRDADGQPVVVGNQISVPALSTFASSPLDASVLIGDVVTPQLNVRSLLKTHLLLRSKEPLNSRPFGAPEISSVTLFGPTVIEFPEEIPIWLLFFYLSSIVRYKPELVERLRDSKYWPVLSTARLHVFLDFLLAFWSFVHQKNCFLVAPQ